MKKLLLFGIPLTVCVIIVSIVSAQVHPVGMISYWKFDEGNGNTAYDSVNEHDGIIYGATWATGIVGNALDFNMSYVLVAASPPIRDFTYAVWVKPRAASDSGSHQVISSWYKSWKDAFRMSIAQNKVTIGVEDGCCERYPVYSSSGSIQNDIWYYIVGVKEGNTLKLYLDGQFIGSSAGVPNPTDGGTAPPDFAFGKNPHYYGEFFNGLIDELAIYNRALTPCEIYQHYNNGLAGKGYAPEDSIETLIINVEDLGLPKGIEKSLTSQLDAAGGSLERGRDNAAKKQLEAFIYLVEVLRGKKLADDEADALIIAVQCIIDNI